ncbi:hypothetical protein ABZ570_16850 [Micromonospora sp. NPDC007271]|uniref:hypothetical protein n=1 Tax=Micromonospora sp. NPDC007271 TaxID=3154587 RepID=UPI0033C24C54
MDVRDRVVRIAPHNIFDESTIPSTRPGAIGDTLAGGSAHSGRPTAGGRDGERHTLGEGWHWE